MPQSSSPPRLALLTAFLALVALPAGAQPQTPAGGSTAGVPATGEPETAPLERETGLESTAAEAAGEVKKEEQEAAAEEPQPDRVTFDVKLESGERAKGSATTFDYQPGRYVLASDGFELKLKDITVRADRARLDIPENRLLAEGNVILDEGPRRISADSVEWDLTNQTGKFTNATAVVESEYYFKGAEIAKLAEATYSVRDGVFTSCSQEVPSWSIHLSSAEVTLEEYAHIRNARMRFKGVPVLYVPYMLWPAKTDRASGFLVPQPSYSRRRGAYLGLAYFQTFGRSADATFFADFYSKEFFGLGTEIRYRPSEHSTGDLRFYALDEPADTDEDDFPIFDPTRERGDLRWKVQYHHETKKQSPRWGSVQGVVDIEDYSDFDFLSDYERNVDRQTRSFIYSNAYLSLNKGTQSFNLLVDQRERIQRAGTTDVRRQLPEVEYRLRPTRLGNSPLYLSLQSSASYFSVEREDLLDDSPDRLDETNRWGRADLFPTFSLPLSSIPWLSAKIEAGGRATHYTDTIDPATGEFTGESLTRTFPRGALEVVGPSFSRIYDLGGERFSKMKHLIQPRVEYTYVGDFEEQDEISLFDEIDSFRPANGAVVTLANRFLAKPAETAEDGGGGAFEIASFELSQSYSFDDEQPGQSSRDRTLTKNEGPLVATLRINPSRGTSLKTEVSYNTLFSRTQSLSLSGNVKLGASTVGLTWFTRWNAETGDKTSDQARFFTSLQLIKDKLRLDSELSYDVVESELLQQRHFITWQGQCYGLQLELRESVFGDLTERDYRFALTLKNVGTFLDLTGGLDSR